MNAYLSRITASLLMALVLSQAALAVPAFCSAGGWFCMMTAQESTCCPDSTPLSTASDAQQTGHQSSAQQLCHPPSSPVTPLSSCDNCSQCNIESGTDTQSHSSGIVIPSASPSAEALLANVIELEESHSDAVPTPFQQLNTLPPAAGGPLFVVYQSFLN